MNGIEVNINHAQLLEEEPCPIEPVCVQSDWSCSAAD